MGKGRWRRGQGRSAIRMSGAKGSYRPKKMKNLIFGQKKRESSIWRFRPFWRDRMERKHILHRNRPRASNILSHRIMESLKFMIFGKWIFHGSIFHGFSMEAGGRQKMWGGVGGAGASPTKKRKSVKVLASVVAGRRNRKTEKNTKPEKLAFKELFFCCFCLVLNRLKAI